MSPPNDRPGLAAVSRVELALSATPSRLEEHVLAVEAALPTGCRGDELRAGLAEALGNAIIHGALGVSYERRAHGDLEGTLHAIELAEARLGSERHVQVEIVADEGGAAISIADGGPGFDWRAPSSTGGFGLTIMRQAFREVRWNHEGNVVHLTVGAAGTAAEDRENMRRVAS